MKYSRRAEIAGNISPALTTSDAVAVRLMVGRLLLLDNLNDANRRATNVTPPWSARLRPPFHQDYYPAQERTMVVWLTRP